MNRVVAAPVAMAASVICAMFASGEGVIAAPRCYPPSRYQVNSGIVSDSATGLTWQQGVSPQPLSWNDAQTYCGTLLGGFRLPGMKELQSIIDYAKGTPGPTINSIAFPNTPAAAFWSSSPAAGTPSLAWIVFFDYGSTNVVGITSTYQVRCVR